MRNPMRLSCLVLVACLAAGCDEEPRPSAESAVEGALRTRTPPPPVANPDGVPVAVVPGGKLVDRHQSTWTYAYRGVEPREIATKQRAELDKGGWATALREQALEGLPPPVFAALGHRNGEMISALVFKDSKGTIQSTITHASSMKQLMSPPAGYPSGFPFLPFAIHHVGKPAKPGKRLSFVYSGALDGLVAEMRDAVKRDGWACTGPMVAFTVCRKSGREVYVDFSSMSSNRTLLFVSI